MASINGTPDTVRLPDKGFATPAYGASPLIADGDNTMSEGAWANAQLTDWQFDLVESGSAALSCHMALAAMSEEQPYETGS